MRCDKLAEMKAEKRHEALQAAGFRICTMRNQEMILVGGRDIRFFESSQQDLKQTHQPYNPIGLDLELERLPPKIP